LAHDRLRRLGGRCGGIVDSRDIRRYRRVGRYKKDSHHRKFHPRQLHSRRKPDRLHYSRILHSFK